MGTNEKQPRSLSKLLLLPETKIKTILAFSPFHLRLCHRNSSRDRARELHTMILYSQRNVLSLVACSSFNTIAAYKRV